MEKFWRESVPLTSFPVAALKDQALAEKSSESSENGRENDSNKKSELTPHLERDSYQDFNKIALKNKQNAKVI